MTNNSSTPEPEFVGITDEQAMNMIHEQLSGREWSGADDLEAIGEIVTMTGRTIAAP